MYSPRFLAVSSEIGPCLTSPIRYHQSLLFMSRILRSRACSSAHGSHGWFLPFLCLSFASVHSSASVRCLLVLIKFLVYGGCIHNVFQSESRSEKRSAGFCCGKRMLAARLR